jgi:hypothetical protein
MPANDALLQKRASFASTVTVFVKITQKILYTYTPYIPISVAFLSKADQRDPLWR